MVRQGIKSTPVDLTIRQLFDPADPALDAVERIYVDALPAAERKPVEWLRSLARPDRAGVVTAYTVLVAEREAEAIGFAVLFVPADPDGAALLEYLAVDDRARGGGVGSRLLARSIQLAGRPMLVEVETSDADADRRRAFYRRHGCREVPGLSYALPLPSPPPMALMASGARQFSRQILRRWLVAIYVQVYGQSPDDPRIGSMIDMLPDPVVLTES
jgi:GNAT superfamily N-acetyltransferase